MQAIQDKQEQCRCCGGKGGSSHDEYEHDHYVSIWEPCWRCNGTGRETILLRDAAGA